MADEATAATDAPTGRQEDPSTAAASSTKRPAEDDTEAEAAPDVKRQKTETAADADEAATDGVADGAAAAAETKEPAAAANADGGAADTAAAATDADGTGPSEDAEDGKEAAEASRPSKPTVLAFRTFANGEECFTYFHELLTRLTPDQDLNEYEFNMVMDLLRKGHPTPDSKIGSGVRAIQIKRHQEMDSTCYFVLRMDGTQEDFSYRKCIARLLLCEGQILSLQFPEHEAKPPRGGSKPRIKGGRGRRDSGGGRGGRGGRGRGRGGGRGGRGRGRRGG